MEALAQDTPKIEIKTPTSTLSKAFWLLRNRPGVFYRTARGYFLFYFARAMRTLLPLKGVTLAPNVRLQRNGSLVVEAPSASVSIGANSIVYEDSRVECYGRGNVSVGADSILGEVRIVCRHSIEIGERFLSSWNVFIQDFDPHPADPQERGQQLRQMTSSFRPSFTRVEPVNFKWSFPGEKITIGDDVWVGANATILKGARIGSGCIVAAGAVVTRGEYPPNTLLAGNPARVVKQLQQRHD